MSYILWEYRAEKDQVLLGEQEKSSHRRFWGTCGSGSMAESLLSKIKIKHSRG